jgi:hypothetical protein
VPTRKLPCGSRMKNLFHGSQLIKFGFMKTRSIEILNGGLNISVFIILTEI